jgi:N-acetyl-anhydromuramyl-L-alanine amidase AmpD
MPIRYVVIHATRGPEGTDQYNGTINWFKASQYVGWGPSADILIGRFGQITLFADQQGRTWETTRANWSAGYGASAWNTYGADEAGVSIEICQSAAQEDYTVAQINAVADVLAYLHEHKGVALERIPYLDQAVGIVPPSGIVGHEDTANGRKTGKSDPGPKFPYEKVLALAREKTARLSRPMVEEDLAKIWRHLYGYPQAGVSVTRLSQIGKTQRYQIEIV